jgi:hypothetical protein
MAGPSLDTTAQLLCPHGGHVQIVSTNTRARAAGFMITSSDIYTVIGCPFQIPATPPIPSPCLTVRWVVTDQRVKVSGAAALSQSCVGICLNQAQAPQGTVVVASAQTRVQSQ